MNTLGVDASLNGTGLCVTRDREVLQSWRVSVNGKLRGVSRLMYIRNKVRLIIQQYAVTVVAMEGYSFGSGGRAFSIGELGGILKVVMHEENVSAVEVPPSILKQYSTGKGGAKKPVVADAVLGRWGYSFRSDDETDAFVLALIADEYSRTVTNSALPNRHLAGVVPLNIDKIAVITRKTRRRVRAV